MCKKNVFFLKKTIVFFNYICPFAKNVVPLHAKILAFADADAEDKAIFEEFKQSKLDIVFRMIGSASEVAVDLRIRYQDMNN